ncbi:Uncharacterised protein [Klebsiella michiganensis]|uniref:Uncharacterized protein n=1 Tax=Klebsiella michiganensis TaxID=1134687 RepID=A0A7H4N1R9_9ENTR|nr:Uncharacterised protein [Klebsiella michiganensis]
MIPEFGLAAEAAQFNHRQREIEAVVFGFLHDGLIELKRRHVLGSMGGNQPAVITNRNEDTNFHTYLSACR